MHATHTAERYRVDAFQIRAIAARATQAGSREALVHLAAEYDALADQLDGAGLQPAHPAPRRLPYLRRLPDAAATTAARRRG